MLFAAVYELVVGSWPFEADEYPELKGATREKKFAFGLNHVLKHMMKSVGAIAAQLEDVDHLRVSEVNVGAVRVLARKMIVNAIRLAELVGYEPDAIVRDMQDWVAAKQNGQVADSS